MSLTNLNNKHLTDVQEKAIFDTLDALEVAFEPLNINLTPGERQRLGSVNEQNKLLRDKVGDFAKNEPSKASPDVDWDEFFRDVKSSTLMEKILLCLQNFQTRAQNVKILHDYDSFQDALDDYAYTGYRFRTSKSGYETKYKELKQFFTPSRRRGDKDPKKTDSSSSSSTDTVSNGA